MAYKQQEAWRGRVVGGGGGGAAAVMDVNQQRVEKLRASSVLPLMFPKYMHLMKTAGAERCSAAPPENVECLQDDKTVCR